MDPSGGNPGFSYAVWNLIRIAYNAKFGSHKTYHVKSGGATIKFAKFSRFFQKLFHKRGTFHEGGIYKNKIIFSGITNGIYTSLVAVETGGLLEIPDYSDQKVL